MNGKAEGRWLGISPRDLKRTITLRANALHAYDGKRSELLQPGPRSRVGTIHLYGVSSACCPNVTYLLFGGVLLLLELKVTDDSTASGGARAQGAGGVHPASWGSQRGGGRADGRRILTSR